MQNVRERMSGGIVLIALDGGVAESVVAKWMHAMDVCIVSLSLRRLLLLLLLLSNSKKTTFSATKHVCLYCLCCWTME